MSAWPRLEQLTAPAVPPVTYDAVKAHLRLDMDDDAAALGHIIQAAAAFADGAGGSLGRCLITQSWRAHYDRFETPLVLPLPPLQSVTQIQYIDGAGTLQTLAGADYTAHAPSPNWPAEIRPAWAKSWPATRAEAGAVRVEFSAGYGAAAADLPEDLRQGLLFLIAHWFENREAVSFTTVAELPFAIKTLLGRYKVHRL